MSVPLFVVDAFTDVAFAGNPAAVCLLQAWGPERWLQAVAREMNLAETAFLVPNARGFELRWFTPKVEVDLCGHATLAAAHVLWQTERVPSSSAIHFETRSGILKAARRGSELELDFPLQPAEECAAPPQLIEALGITPRYVGKSRFDYLVEVDSEATVRSTKPNFQNLASVTTRGVIVTARSDHSRYDFVSRFFAPACGINEDPVTGSAHCCLGDFGAGGSGRANLWHSRLPSAAVWYACAWLAIEPIWAAMP